MKQFKITRFPELDYAGAEAVNTLCTNLSFSGEKVKKILITSCREHEGKSFICMNVMRNLARLGKKVAMVDADLRRSNIVRDYGLKTTTDDKRTGLTHLLAGHVSSMEDVIYVTDMPNTVIVPVGKTVSNSLPLLNSSRFPELMDVLAEQCDYVLVDAPPIGALIDASQIAKYCDGILLVVSYNKVRRQELTEVVEQLQQTGCPILGTVLNMTDYESYLNRKYYYKSYGERYYRYYKKDGKDEKSKRHRKEQQDT